MTDLTHTEFLLACIAEDEKDFAASESDEWAATSADLNDGAIAWMNKRMRTECEVKRRIIALHESWPTLVETPIETETSHSLEAATGDTITGYVIRASKQIAWLTTREYVARFGMDPPTAPILAFLTLPFADRPGCRPEWLP